ncbi:pitrilysin family protein [Gymnodinialimonas sp. 2305UL16-5]|uniref:M16 family metallopeptidase n=1 Tax=Gymnodinialimonas mytili TaxID=3126503 RepID=UPI0030963D72
MIARFIAPAFALIAFALPASANVDIQRVTSPGGLEAWLVQDNSIPFVAIDLWFDGGGSADVEGARGAVHLMAATLEEGTGDLDSQQFAATLEGLAASFSFSTYRDNLVVSAQMLTENREDALALLRGALVEPSFDPVAVERVRTQVIQGLQADANDPNDIASLTFNELAFQDHPYGSSLDGTIESVTALTRDDLVTAHRNILVRDRVAIGVAGDITPEDLGVLLDNLLGDLPLAEIELPGDVTPTLPGGVSVVDFPTPQSSVLFGHSGIARDDPDFFPAFVMNQVLGAGGYRSRLMEEVREQRGLTYGISTWLSLGANSPMMMGGFSSSNDLVGEAIEVVQAQWADIAENGITQAELEAAQRYMTGSYPLRFEGNSEIAGIMAAMQSDDMPVDYINTRNDNVMAVTVEDIQRVAARLVDPDGLHFVVVGQPEGLEASN